MRRAASRRLRQAVLWGFSAALLGAGLAAGGADAVRAIERTERGEVIFDINDPADMREVGVLSGIEIRDDIDTAIGYIECRRWARQFGVHPFRAVVSGYLPGRPTRVWICSGEADSRRLSERYCTAMGMNYKEHDGSRVTCQIGETM